MKQVMNVDNITLEYPLPRRYRDASIMPSGVRKVSIEVKQGEVLGIVGRNGSGKSTLLKLMAGVFPPDEGSISIRGSVSLLAGVGVGFHKDLTGRENAYLYGALMGRTQQQIDRLIDEIQAFSELQHHFDRPLRTYSSGMKSRLGISVATAFKPDLLLIDEVLGVGDISFREKSQKRVKQLINESGSVVIVSHSLGLLKSICTKLVVIENGEIIHYGGVEQGLEKYTQLMKSDKNNLEKQEDETEIHPKGHPNASKSPSPSFRTSIEQSMSLWRENSSSPRSKLINRLNKKLAMKRFIDEKTPIKSNILGLYDDISKVDFSKLPDEFVIKPQDGASNNGVFVLRRNPDGTFNDAMRNTIFTREEIISVYLDEYQKYKSIHLPIYIEERYHSANESYSIPLDYKGFCFNGKVCLIMQRDVSGGREYSNWRYAYYDRDWNRLDNIRKGVTFSAELQPPKERKEIVEEMERLSSLIPLRFCSMDMYNTTEGIAFGECTIHPGSYKSFIPMWNEKLGEIYQNTKEPDEGEIIKFLDENASIFGF